MAGASTMLMSRTACCAGRPCRSAPAMPISRPCSRRCAKRVIPATSSCRPHRADDGDHAGAIARYRDMALPGERQWILNFPKRSPRHRIVLGIGLAIAQMPRRRRCHRGAQRSRRRAVCRSRSQRCLAHRPRRRREGAGGVPGARPRRARAARPDRYPGLQRRQRRFRLARPRDAPTNGDASSTSTCMTTQMVWAATDAPATVRVATSSASSSICGIEALGCPVATPLRRPRSESFVATPRVL